MLTTVLMRWYSIWRDCWELFGKIVGNYLAGKLRTVFT